MTGPDLLQRLMDHHGLNANSLSRKAEGAKQSQIHKYLNNAIKEPKRTTLEPLALFFEIPLNAFYDPDLAQRLAQQLGLARPPTTFDYSEAEVIVPLTTREERAAYIFPKQQLGVRGLIHQFRTLLEHQPPGVRMSVVAIMKDIAERADDATFAESMIDRILGALGMPGNAQPPKSIPSANQGEASN